MSVKWAQSEWKMSIEWLLTHAYGLTGKLFHLVFVDISRNSRLKFDIPPTSVASKSAFSISGNFLPKSRVRMTDQALDYLCFEKVFFPKYK